MSAVDLIQLARSGPVHFVGIAGAGMSALAELVLRGGGLVSGCDAKPGAVGDALRRAGADVVQGHDASHVADASAVVTTAAVPADHAELAAARERGIPVLKRAEALGAIVNRGRVVAIAGTHGKTTTTAMTTLVLERGGLDPTGFVGGHVAAWGGGLRLGAAELYVVEADEFDRSFHTLEPDVAAVTAIEADHLDIYGTLAEVEAAFRSFLEPVPEDGMIALCVDDAGVVRLREGLDRPGVLGYGLSDAAGLRAATPVVSGSNMRFGVTLRGEPLGEMTLQVPGVHNVRNALCAVAVGLHLGVEFGDIQQALAGYEPVARRFEVVGEAGGVVVVDDYAHHPTEVRATLEAARTAYPSRRLVAVFQPHLFTRTRDFHEEFGSALALADRVWVADVYPAREPPIEGVSGALVADAARRAQASHVEYRPDLDELRSALEQDVQARDLVVTMGAGDVDRVGRGLFAYLSDGDAAGGAGGAA